MVDTHGLARRDQGRRRGPDPGPAVDPVRPRPDGPGTAAYGQPPSNEWLVHRTVTVAVMAVVEGARTRLSSARRAADAHGSPRPVTGGDAARWHVPKSESTPRPSPRSRDSYSRASRSPTPSSSWRGGPGSCPACRDARSATPGGPRPRSTAEPVPAQP